MLPQHTIPHLAPRHPRLALSDKLKTHKFQLLFGGLWATVGLINALVFCFADSVQNNTTQLLIMGGIGAFFALSGIAFLLFTAARIARDTALLRYGQLAPAYVERVSIDPSLRVNNRPATRIDLRWTTPDGQHHRDYRRLFDQQLIDAHPEGLALPILIDPLQPDVFVVPSLYNASFLDLASPEDRRQHLDPTTPPLREPTEAAQHTLASPITLLPSGWWTLLSRRRRKQLPPYTLDLHHERLTLREAEREAASIDLSRPFALHLTTWLLDDHTARLHLRLHQRGAPPDAPSLTFSVDLPQERVDRDIPLQQRDAPKLDEPSFNDLWNTLSFYASLHGEQLKGITTAATQRHEPHQTHTPHRHNP